MEWFIRDISEKYFAESVPQNYTGANKAFGTGTNGKLTIEAADTKSTVKVTFAVATAKSTAMSVSVSSGVITVTLGTTDDSTVTADATATTGKNTVKKIAEAINASADCKALGITASYSGTGATAYTTAASNQTLTDGNYGTPCPIAYSGFVTAEGTYYVCTIADSTKTNKGWKKFTLIDL